MLLGLLMYAYCRGVRSSRQVERLCGTDAAFRVLCAQDVPDHSTIARFRADCQDAFAALFTQVLLVAAQAGLARFGTVAIDGTKIAANASLDANRGQEWLQRQVAEMIQDAEQTDAGEDVAARGSDGPGPVPAPLGDRTGRARRIREAAAQVASQAGRRARADQERDQAALERQRHGHEATLNPRAGPATFSSQTMRFLLRRCRTGRVFGAYGYDGPSWTGAYRRRRLWNEC